MPQRDDWRLEWRHLGGLSHDGIESSALDGLEDFSVRVIVVGNCPGWVEDLAGVHHFKLLDKSKVVAVSLDGWLGGNWSCGSEVNIPL